MPEYIRALIVILVLSATVFAIAKTPATATAMSSEDFVRRRNTWFYLTLAGFLSHNYWVFVVIASIVLINAAKREHNRIALYFFLLLALPQIKVEIPGFAGIRYFYTIDYVRLLSAIVLVPVCLQARKLAVSTGAKAYASDKILAIYIVLNLVLQAQHDIATEVVRSTLSWIIDVVVPYYAISRSLKDVKGMRETWMSFVVAAMPAAMVAVFEFVRHWILYSSAGDALGVEWDPGYLARGEMLRASATSGQAIVLGYIMAIAIGLFLALRQSVPIKKFYLAGMALLVAGIVAPVSRGPWVGLVVILLLFVATGEKPLQRIIKFSLAALPVGIALMFTPYGQKIIDYLPFIGNVEKENVTYRQNLFETSVQIIRDHPFFGSTDYLLHMEELRQGQGIIDLVNTFLIVGLNTGLVGLSLYLLFFFTVLRHAFKAMRHAPRGSELRVQGQALLAVLVGILLIIATVSPIYQVPILLWSVAAMCLAYGSLGLPARKP